MKQFGYLLFMLCLAASIYAQPPAKEKHFFKYYNTAEHGRSGSFTYTLSVLTDDYNDLENPVSINNGEIWDDPEYSVNLGFPFELNGHTITSLNMYGVGTLLAGATGIPDLVTATFPFEADLIDRGYVEEIESLSPISYERTGSPGSRIFKVEWKNAGSYYEYEEFGTTDMFVNVQLWLYEGINRVEFRYGPQSITNEGTFYGGEPGAYIGITDADDFTGDVYDAHFITGNALKPALSEELLTINGTPPEGFVYVLSLPGQDLQLDLVSENSGSYCDPDGSATATVSGGLPPYTYAWSNGGTTPTISGLDAGTYGITVTDSDNNTVSGSINIDGPDAMDLDITSTDETGAGANDGTATVIASGGTPGYEYEWSNGESTTTITGLAPGVYTVTVFDNAGCSETATAFINPFGCGELLVEAAVQAISCFGNCDGGIEIMQVVGGTGPFEYEWSNGSTNHVISNLCAGTYSVTVIDANLCIGNATFLIEEPALLVANAFATAETLLGENDGTATAAAFGGVAPYSYLWSNGETTQQIIGLPPGTYSVIVTDINNCTALDTVTVEAGPCAILTGTVTDATCHEVCDGSIDIAPGFDSYSWSNGSASGDLNSLCAGEYTVTATLGDSCSVVATFVVGQPAHLVANTGSTSETAAGGDGTAWVIPSGGTPPYAFLWNTGSTDSLIINLGSDTYSVTLTDANGCIDSAEVFVNEFSCFVIDQNEVQHVFCHDSCDGLIFVVPIGGVGPYEYAWSTKDTSNIVFDLCSGWYSVTITDLGQNGCSNFVDIEILEPDSFYYTVEEIVHLTDSTEASIDVTFHGGTEPYFPLWFGPDLFVSFDEDISNLQPGTYILNLFDSHDCSVVDSIVVLDLTTSLPVLPAGQVDIYPNPASDKIVIDYQSTDNYTVDLYSPVGVKTGTWENAHQIDVRHVTPGLYVVMFKNEEGYFIKRIVVE